MSPDKYVASTGIRAFTLIMGGICTVLIVHRVHDLGIAATIDAWSVVLVWISGILAAIGGIHCFHSVYAGWMRFSKALHHVVVSVLFGTCYLVIVPIFWIGVRLADPLRLRHTTDPDTYWIKRRQQRFDLREAQRMG